MINYTEEILTELRKCKDDIGYFATTYVNIFSVTSGTIKFSPYPVQLKFLETIAKNQYVICNGARQTSKSLIPLIYILHTMIFNSEQRIGLVANKQAVSIAMLGILKEMYQLLPEWMKPTLKICNNAEIETVNGMSVVALSPRENSLRGCAFSILVLDEFDYIRNGKELIALAQLSTMCGKLIITSTRKSILKDDDSAFDNIWFDALEGKNKFVPFKINWDAITNRTKEWKEQMIRCLGEEIFEREYVVP